MASRGEYRTINDEIEALEKKIADLNAKMTHVGNSNHQRSSKNDSNRTETLAELRSTHDKLVRELKVKRIEQSYGKRKPQVTKKVVKMTVIEARLDPSMGATRLKITTIEIGENSTSLNMTPPWFQNEWETEGLRNIKYPSNVSNKRPFDTLAQYRVINKQSNDFRNEPVQVQEGSTEIIILALDSFIHQYGGKISFNTDDLSFEGSADRAACGIADLGSTHMVVNEHVTSANFTLLLDLNYDDLAKSRSTMENFVLSFVDALAKDLSCCNNSIRITGVNRSSKLKGKAEISLVLTTTDRMRTEALADLLKAHCKSGFPRDNILKHVIPDDYICKWMPVLSHLQLQPWDFDTKFNMDYKKPDLVEKDNRGGYPYYLPIGWYRHALKVDKKYDDNPLWLGSSAEKGVWPVAFHGTKSQAVKSITEGGLKTGNVVRDAMLQEAIKQAGPSVNRPGLYVATHCNGGSHPLYTQSFTVDMPPNKNETFQVVFQCRVEPGSFTRHTAPVRVGEAWRVVDPSAIRPYGILLKTADSKVPFET